MKTKYLAVILLFVSGCGVRLQPGDARAFNDDLLYQKITRHQEYLAKYDNERRQHNLNMMVAEMQRRHPNWEPGMAFPQEEARASYRAESDPNEAPSTSCSDARIHKLQHLGMKQPQIDRICGRESRNE